MPQEQVHASRAHDQHQADQHTEMDAIAEADAGERTTEAQATLDHTDELLDEIDAILIAEENFARNYVQKGGE